MAKINKLLNNIPLKTKMRVHELKRQMKQNGHKNFVTKVNKEGDIAILAYKSPEHDKLVVSNVIKPDGQEILKLYKTCKDKHSKSYTKIIETWERIKNNLIFKKASTIEYKDYYKVPASVTTIYSDANSHDGVNITRTFPLEKYMEHFKRPQA